jgi:hypothetical protein
LVTFPLKRAIPIRTRPPLTIRSWCKTATAISWEEEEKSPGHDAYDANADVQIKMTAGKSAAMYAECVRLVVLRVVSPEEAEIVYDREGVGLCRQSREEWPTGCKPCKAPRFWPGRANMNELAVLSRPFVPELAASLWGISKAGFRREYLYGGIFPTRTNNRADS